MAMGSCKRMLQSIPITGAVLSLSDAHGSAQPYLGSFAPRNDPQKSILRRAPRLEEFCRLLIEEFGVQPEREDAMAVLEENLKVFKTHKTW